MELTLQEKLERVRDLRPIDDVFFEVLANDTAVCEEMLRTILEDANLTVREVIVQNSERNLYGHSVRLDALCVLGSGALANIEVQRSDNDDHLRRARFNASSVTLRGSQAGAEYSEIPDVIIVYISESDIFRQNRTIYHMEKVLRETGTVVSDGLTEVFVNTAVQDGSAIAELMQCFMLKQVNNARFPELSKRVTELKSTEGGLTAVCDVMKKYVEIAKAEGIAEGVAKGIAEGVAKGVAKGAADEKIALAKKLLASTQFTDAQIADLTGLEQEKVAALRNGSAA